MEVAARSGSLYCEKPCHSQDKSISEFIDYAEDPKIVSVEDNKFHSLLTGVKVVMEHLHSDVQPFLKPCSNGDTSCVIDDREDYPEEQNQYNEACLDFQNAHVDVNTIDSDSICDDKDEELSISASKWPEHDEALALWVKWRGRWQAGIKCERADWPLATVKAKPTHDRKSYIVIFFPHTKNYCWADTLLVCAIDELPHPIAHRSHKAGVLLVEDLTVARRFIMKKLVIGVLNIVDQLPVQVLAETGRNVVAWREFAAEASCCKGYPDIGRLLVKLLNMLSQQYVNSNWLQNSFHLWAEKCHNAFSADSIELLKEVWSDTLVGIKCNRTYLLLELYRGRVYMFSRLRILELVESILWSETNTHRNIDRLPALGSEWKVWKHEIMKCFSTTASLSAGGNNEQPGKITAEQLNNTSLITSPQVSRKRPKLEVRRAEANNSQLENRSPPKITPIEIDASFFTLTHDVAADNVAVPCKEELIHQGTPEVTSPDNRVQVQDVMMNDVSETKYSSSKIKSRQCIAFVEAKERRCVRWANDGEDYCCAHLLSRVSANPPKMEIPAPDDTPMCQGTTTLGQRCKHRSLPDSPFCKKHRAHEDGMMSPGSPECHMKRKLDELSDKSEYNSCKDIVIFGEAELPPEERSLTISEKTKVGPNGSICTETAFCVGFGLEINNGICPDTPTRHSLYCDKHIPIWLKRARNGKSRIITKEVFLELLRACSSQNQRILLHQACEVFYKLFKSILSLRNPVPKEIQLQWAVSEASKDLNVAEFLMKLVTREKERLHRIWGIELNKNEQLSSLHLQEQALVPVERRNENKASSSFKCTLCSGEFCDDQTLGAHWVDSHNKEAQWLFRGYACAICLDSFTNQKVLETHVQERHHAQFVEHCMLLQCIPCGSHFGNFEELWSHVLSAHTERFRQSKTGDPFSTKPLSIENNSGTHGSDKRFTCKFCDLKFDLLPDLGRHHQAAHMGPSSLNARPRKRGLHFYTYRLKSGRLSRPRLKKALGGASYRLRNSGSVMLKKRLQPSSLPIAGGISMQTHVTAAASLARLTESQCSAIAKMLCSEAHKTKARPTNREILSIARSACCKVGLQCSLEQKYGALPERLYLKAAKLCSEHDIQVNWHQEAFNCPRGCKSQEDHSLGEVLALRPNECERMHPPFLNSQLEYEMDECHYVIDSRRLRRNNLGTTIILCDDISYGQEKVAVPCVVEKHLIDSLHTPTYAFDGKVVFLPWEAFTYATKPQFDPSPYVSAQLGCGCSQSGCASQACDHVYLFNTDFENAKDIDGKPMEQRFPYDDEGRLMVEDNYLVYECNHLCKCNRNCPNRVLQNGVRTKLEVFKTANKGWAVRASEKILRGTFVCELVGEVLDLQEAERRRNRYSMDSCDYIYNTSILINKVSNLMEGQAEYVIDSTRYGNISRFIHHSCSPNLTSQLVLVESMDFQFAHVGLYAKRDIDAGEELSFDHRSETLPKTDILGRSPVR